MTVEELLAREEIRQLLATYSIAGDRADYETMASVFAEDGVLDGASHRVGREAIVRSLADRPTTTAGPDRPIGFSRHCLTTSLVTFQDETSASGRTYFVVFTESGPDHVGVYVDRFRKIGGRWMIQHRDARIDWAGETGHVRPTRPPARA
ncbi:nuclear transport factor 2 family protein [Phenylobacterium sp.]|jgi:hypothetical protein|uniref:nuclear transport factor 2 family protein n=1 Tax=Phenylobacterium sp. TaxID=1871053 RepID=UPI002E34F980|nr:nuclear transport factor 2 family protein [Phenylobacterium sp.]HEX3367258.1 nuclear transport factor 2 family protein [Phenylobacterium sp.]